MIPSNSTVGLFLSCFNWLFFYISRIIIWFIDLFVHDVINSIVLVVGYLLKRKTIKFLKRIFGSVFPSYVDQFTTGSLEKIQVLFYVSPIKLWNEISNFSIIFVKCELTFVKRLQCRFHWLLSTRRKRMVGDEWLCNNKVSVVWNRFCIIFLCNLASSQLKVVEAASVNKHILLAVTIGLSLICIFRFAFITIKRKHVLLLVGRLFGRPVCWLVSLADWLAGWLVFCKIEPCCYLSATSCFRFSWFGIKARVLPGTYTQKCAIKIKVWSSYKHSPSVAAATTKSGWVNEWKFKVIGIR